MGKKLKQKMAHYYINCSLFPITLEAQEEATTLHFASKFIIKYRNPLSGEWYDFDDSHAGKLTNKSHIVS